MPTGWTSSTGLTLSTGLIAPLFLAGPTGFGWAEPEGIGVYVPFICLPDCCWQAFHSRPARRPVAGSHAGADRRWRHCSGQSPRPEAVNSIKLHRFRQPSDCQPSPWHQEPPLQSKSVDPYAESVSRKVVDTEQKPTTQAGSWPITGDPLIRRFTA